MALKSKLCFLILCLAAIAAACRWDRDTLAEEAKGSNLDVLKVIVGRFERNPPLYYQMRLDRVAKEIESNSGNLDLYNDAAVACDHLGKFNDAIAWMQKQEKVIAKGRVTSDAMYRYHANLGTFYAHRWFANKADKDKPQDLNKGIEHIRRAIEINPVAHFGREKFQLAIMQWVREGGDDQPIGTPLGDYLVNKKLMDWGEAEGAVKGLTGLIRLGNAWESVDVYAALGDALAHERLGTTGEAALARVLELQKEGKSSITGWRLKMASFIEGRPMGIELAQAHEEYKRLREEADAWHKSRSEFMIAKLNAGKHPDTNKDFWDGYISSEPKVQGVWFWKRQGFQISALITGILVALGATAFFVIRAIYRAHRPKKAPFNIDIPPPDIQK